MPSKCVAILYLLASISPTALSQSPALVGSPPPSVDRKTNSETGCGFGREATLWLLNHGIRVGGTDAWSWDAPFSYTRQRFVERGDPSIIWEGHKAGREKAYCQMEKLANLEALPSIGFTVCCFPVKIKGASAGFARVVALLNQDPNLKTD